MTGAQTAWRKRCAAWVQGRLAPLLLVLTLGLASAGVARADTAAVAVAYRCDGQPWRAILHSGAVDDPTSPNSSAGTLPGAFVVLQSDTLQLQLPRTNNAGAPSFTDGKWWWSLEDPDHPTLLLRRPQGDVQRLQCERQG